jgi:serine/threonine protein kinase
MRIPQDIKWKATGSTLGAGGQATVVEVFDESDVEGTRYALKGLSKDRPQQAYDRFYREIEAIKKLDHPFIIKIIDHSEADADFHYYVMELLKDATSLKRVLEAPLNPFVRNPLKSLPLFHKLLQVIDECQKNRIVHRDLSLANVLVIPDESIRVIDFGICQIIDGESLTLVDEGVGTPNYMSPECESGAEGQVSSKSDVYSAGKILWSLITGQRAFARELPVFSAKSMKSMFPDQPDTWHLRLFFERTVREEPNKRWYADELLQLSTKIQAVIQEGFPPIEQTTERCPICGLGSLKPLLNEHPGYPVPRGLEWLQCNYCGFWFQINKQLREAGLKERDLHIFIEKA